MTQVKHFNTIGEFHQFRSLPKPNHPLFSVVDVSTVSQHNIDDTTALAMNFYSISVKRMHNVKVRYGQKDFDFNEGIMSFMSPNQVFNMAVDD